MRQNLKSNELPSPMRVGRLWLFPDGTTLPVVSGGADDDGGEGENDDPVKLTNKQLNDLIAERVRKAKGSATQDLLKQLGTEDLEAVKAALKRNQELEDQNKTDLEKAKSEATTEKQKRESAEQTVAEVKLTTRIEKALIMEGMTVAAAERGRKLIDIDPKASDDDIKAEIEALRKDMPALFSEAPEGEGEGRKPAGANRTPPPPPGRPPAQPKSSPSKADKATQLLHERHPHLKKN